MIPPSDLPIMDISKDTKRLILGPPGSGKTYLISSVVNSLVISGLRVLVFSFANTSIYNLRSRLGAVSNNSLLSISTIDSYVIRFLSNCCESYQVDNLSNNEAIQLASNLLTNLQLDHQLDFDFLIIDELQDTVGVRAEFLLSMLKVLDERNLGFLALGDPAQGIYEFSLDHNSIHRAKDTEYVIEAVRDLARDTQQISIGHSSRFREENLKKAVSKSYRSIMEAYNSRESKPPQYETAISHIRSYLHSRSSNFGAWVQGCLESKKSTFLLFPGMPSILRLCKDGSLSNLDVSIKSDSAYPHLPLVLQEFIEGSDTSSPLDCHESWLSPFLEKYNNLKVRMSFLQFYKDEILPFLKLNHKGLRGMSSTRGQLSVVHRVKGLQRDCVYIDKSLLKKTSKAGVKELFVAFSRARDEVVCGRSNAPLKLPKCIRIDGRYHIDNCALLRQKLSKISGFESVDSYHKYLSKVRKQLLLKPLSLKQLEVSDGDTRVSYYIEYCGKKLILGLFSKEFSKLAIDMPIGKACLYLGDLCGTLIWHEDLEYNFDYDSTIYKRQFWPLGVPYGYIPFKK